jgi:hypothetical protein
MLQENLKDAVIVHHILAKSFIVPYAKDDITQLMSCLNFDERGIPAFYLSEAIQEHIQAPDPTDTLVFF